MTATTTATTTAIATTTTTEASHTTGAARALKRLLAPLLALMLLVGTVAPATAHAATPTASNCGSSTVYVTRGGRHNFRFFLRSNSYGYRYGYRARFNTDMFKSSTGRRVAYTNYVRYSGPQYHTARYSFPRSSYSRFNWYKLRYRTQYRSSAYSSCWRTATSRYIRVFVF